MNLFRLHVCFQVKNGISALFVYLLAFQYTVCTDRQSVSHSTTKCIGSCEYTDLTDHLRICAECANDPPINYLMCTFACGTNEITDTNAEYLGSICQKCFADLHVMSAVCRNNCLQYFSQFGKMARLCRLCSRYGLTHEHE